jgi:hypothetical protein
MILFSELEAYMISLATGFTRIGHTEEAPRFATLDIDDILGGQRGELDFNHPILILENPEGEMGFKHDRLYDGNYCAFHILQEVNRNDPAAKRQVMDDCKEIGTKVLLYIELDRQKRFKGTNTPPRFVLNFNLSDVKYQKIGPIFSGCFGWRFEFEIGQETPIEYILDEEEWVDPEE